MGEGEADDGGTGSGSYSAGQSSRRTKGGPKKCSVCGERGHDTRTCPQAKVIDAKAKAEVAKAKAVKVAKAGKAKAADSDSDSESESESESEDESESESEDEAVAAAVVAAAASLSGAAATASSAKRKCKRKRSSVGRGQSEDGDGGASSGGAPAAATEGLFISPDRSRYVGVKKHGNGYAWYRELVAPFTSSHPILRYTPRSGGERASESMASSHPSEPMHPSARLR